MSTIYTHSKMRTLFSGEIIRPHGQLWIQRENHAAVAVCDSESAAPKYARGEQDRIGSGYNLVRCGVQETYDLFNLFW